MWFLFFKAALKKARTWKKVTISTSGTKYIKNGWRNSRIWGRDREAGEGNCSDLEN